MIVIMNALIKVTVEQLPSNVSADFTINLHTWSAS